MFRLVWITIIRVVLLGIRVGLCSLCWIGIGRREWCRVGIGIGGFEIGGIGVRLVLDLVCKIMVVYLYHIMSPILLLLSLTPNSPY